MYVNEAGSTERDTRHAEKYGIKDSYWRVQESESLTSTLVIWSWRHIGVHIIYEFKASEYSSYPSNLKQIPGMGLVPLKVWAGGMAIMVPV